MTRTRAFVIVWVILGASLSVSGEVEFALIGFIMQAMSQFAECSRIVMGEILLSGPRKLDPLTYTLFVAPICFVVLVFVNIFAWQPGTVERFYIWWPVLLANALLAFCLNILVATVVKECSAVGFVLTGLIKDIVIVLFSAVFFNETVTQWQYCAFALTLMGIWFWSIMRISPEAAPVQLLEAALGVPKKKKSVSSDVQKARLYEKHEGRSR